MAKEIILLIIITKGDGHTVSVKRHRAQLVLGWGTAWEDLWPLSALSFCFPNMHDRTCFEAEFHQTAAIRFAVQQNHKNSNAFVGGPYHCH